MNVPRTHMPLPAALEPAAARAADYAGRWRVWIMTLPAPEMRRAAIGIWLIDAPGVHPVWRCWQLSLIHLRALDGLDPPRLYTPEMTHELMSFAVDPGTAPNTEDATLNTRLLPPDFGVQFMAKSDKTALLAVEGALRMVAVGKMHPEEQFGPVWKRTLRGTARCIDSGCCGHKSN